MLGAHALPLNDPVDVDAGTCITFKWPYGVLLRKVYLLFQMGLTGSWLYKAHESSTVCVFMPFRPAICIWCYTGS